MENKPIKYRIKQERAHVFIIQGDFGNGFVDLNGLGYEWKKVEVKPPESIQEKKKGFLSWFFTGHDTESWVVNASPIPFIAHRDGHKTLSSAKNRLDELTGVYPKYFYE